MYASILHPVCCIHMRKLGVTVGKTYVVMPYRVICSVTYFQGEAVPILGSFLRKNQRALKLSTLTLLDTLVRNYSSALSTELLNKVSLCL